MSRASHTARPASPGSRRAMRCWTRGALAAPPPRQTSFTGRKAGQLPTHLDHGVVEPLDVLEQALVVVGHKVDGHTLQVRSHARVLVTRCSLPQAVAQRGEAAAGGRSGSGGGARRLSCLCTCLTLRPKRPERPMRCR